MNQFVVDLGIAIPKEFVADVCDRLSYAHAAIQKIEIVPEDARHIRVFLEDGQRIDALHPVLVSNAREMLKGGLEGVQVILKDRRDSVSAPKANAVAELVERGWLAPIARGCFARRGPVLRLLRHLDGLFRSMSLAGGAEEIELSTYASIDTLRKAGHFNASPQHLTFATHLTEDMDLLKSIAAAARETEQPLEPRLAGHFDSGGCCLTPAVCYNLYHILSGRTIEQPQTFAAANRCYRYESGRLEGLARMWEFTMREWIFLGPAQSVTDARSASIEQVWALADKWNLHAWIENANDPFFVGEFDSRAAFQRNREMKFELRLSLVGEFAVAATSFNLHSTTFGNNFRMLLPNGRPACSGCCAWGLERWVAALFSQFGFDSQDWPDDLAQAVWA